MKLIIVLLVLILLFLQFRLWTGAGSLENINSLEKEIAIQQAENVELQKRNEALRQDVRDLKTGEDSIEERARNDLGLIKKGETFYLIVEKETSAEKTSPPDNVAINAGSYNNAVEALPFESGQSTSQNADEAEQSEQLQ